MEGEREPWGGTRCPLEAKNKKKKSKIIPKKSYKILDKRKILWYNIPVNWTSYKADLSAAQEG